MEMLYNVDVAVVMISYNHEKWIPKAIESVLNQKTRANYKIFIHDDASTDNSKKVIEHYVKKNPDVIVPIFQKENQYSLGKNIWDFILPLFQSKYIAICECDDFWFDENKLEMQYNYMENHPQCTYVFGDAYFADIDGIPERRFFWTYPWKNDGIEKKLKQKEGADFNIEEMIYLDFTPTASVMYRSIMQKYINQYQDCFDLTVRICATEKGYAHYFNQILSVYRNGNHISAHGVASSNKESYFKMYYERHVNALNEFDSLTEGKYHKIVVKEIDRKKLQVYRRFLDMDEMRKLKSYKDLKTIPKLRCLIKKNLGVLYTIIKKISVIYVRKKVCK